VLLVSGAVWWKRREWPGLAALWMCHLVLLVPTLGLTEHPYFKIRYSLSLKDRPESSEPMADAQRRWKQFGKLFLNSDGDFFFETDIIINKLPD